jgi:hypothetical protein
MSTFLRAAANTDRPDKVSTHKDRPSPAVAGTPPAAHRPSSAAHRAPRAPWRVALLAGVALLGLLTACGNDTPNSPSEKSPGATEPASRDPSTDTGSAAPSRNASGKKTGTGTGTAAAAAGGTRGGGRCHTSELRASVGAEDPGAGQENFPVVLTNRSGRTCTVRGYPGAAFVDASGKQLGPDPRRSPGTPTTVVLAPGRSAWSGLTFSNPEISGARTATPASLVVTPPDERDSLTVRWTGGEVPVSGDSSSVSLTVVLAGSGP